MLKVFSHFLPDDSVLLRSKCDFNRELELFEYKTYLKLIFHYCAMT